MNYYINGVLAGDNEMTLLKKAIKEFNLNKQFQELSDQHTEYHDELGKSLGYIDRVDMNTTAIAVNEFQDEAINLVNYWTFTYNEIVEYINTEPTEATQKTLLEIITSYEDFINS